MTDRQKLTAAIAAVLYYIKTEDEAMRLAAEMPVMDSGSTVSGKMPTTLSNPWGLHGRQTQMHLQTLMQMRAFRRL